MTTELFQSQQNPRLVQEAHIFKDELHLHIRIFHNEDTPKHISVQ